MGFSFSVPNGRRQLQVHPPPQKAPNQNKHQPPWPRSGLFSSLFSPRVINDQCCIWIQCHPLQELRWGYLGYLLFPASAFHCREFFFGHSMSSCEVAYSYSALFGVWGVREWGKYENSPAVIFASISTLESSGIQDSGSSTRSRIGILSCLAFYAGALWVLG